MAITRSIRGLLSKGHLLAGTTALGGMIVGAVVGIGVQVGFESTGMLGPSVDTLIAEQQSNFDDIHTALGTLTASADDPALGRELKALTKLIQRQDELRRQASSELQFLGEQVASLKDRNLAERGFAGGADFWLKVGESVNVGDARHVLGVVRTWATAVDVVMNGQKSRLSVGDSVSSDHCTVFFKQAVKREDGRVGFDVACG